MALGLKDLVQQARQAANEISPEVAHKAIDQGALVLDVRESGEFRERHVARAKSVPRGLLELKAATDSPVSDPELTGHREERVVVYCTKSPSARSLFAAQTLAMLGYTNVSVLEGGLNAWGEAGLPMEEGP
ncbi:MAG: rhodanese-like domain-containing protein [Actinomycetota bacterium]|nr:rhodanese-like domain-containing protein [Actinomycetota bacterium]